MYGVTDADAQVNALLTQALLRFTGTDNGYTGYDLPRVETRSLGQKTAASTSSQPPYNLVIVGRNPPRSFNDPKEAALYTLLANEVPLTTFLEWCHLRREAIQHNETPSLWNETWRSKPLFDEHEYSDFFFPFAKSGSQIEAIIQPVRTSSPSENLFCLFNSQDDLSSTKKLSVSAKKASSNTAATARKQSRRGSSRRLDHLEGRMICDTCSRKGQSVFDPHNPSEGKVYQYFYCRNSSCSKGKSCNRYIGWTERSKSAV